MQGEKSYDSLPNFTAADCEWWVWCRGGGCGHYVEDVYSGLVVHVALDGCTLVEENLKNCLCAAFKHLMVVIPQASVESCFTLCDRA